MAQLGADGAISSLNFPSYPLARSVACLMARTHFRGFGFLAALLSLAGQLAFGATLPQPVLSRIGFGSPCQTAPAGSTPVHPDRHVPLKAVSPICVALAMPTPLPAAVRPAPLPPALLYFVRIDLRTVTVAPPAAPLAASPRGPPFPA
ncbi:MAG: hypothetical protein ACREE5_04415 [Acetobacteraceae bacterium]